MKFLVQLLRLKSFSLSVFIQSGKGAKVRTCETGLTLKELENSPTSKSLYASDFPLPTLLNLRIGLVDF